MPIERLAVRNESAVALDLVDFLDTKRGNAKEYIREVFHKGGYFIIEKTVDSQKVINYLEVGSGQEQPVESDATL
ncbi:hypothetical protein EXS70_02445 [Candidatus Peribacteria bacterium]|nr:hypothetical protein [Candidatus Peribacteria bacterium]